MRNDEFVSGLFFVSFVCLRKDRDVVYRYSLFSFYIRFGTNGQECVDVTELLTLDYDEDFQGFFFLIFIPTDTY